MKLTRILTAAAAAALLTGVSGGIALAQETDPVTLTTSGSGAEEVPSGTGQDGATLAGTFTLAADDTLTYTLSVTGADEPLTMGHIHQGAAGANGDVVVPLDIAAISAGTEATAMVPAEVADAMRADPSGFYANVHSASYAPPAGVARGQLSLDGAAAPSVVNTGTGGQAAGPDAGALALLGGVGLAAVAGSVLVARRRRTS
ncbi:MULTISPECIES: CHRD domain-containing protein [Pseudonocardia]|uniref:CHRD domain-containing protein n=1 Tax=Pseudonocardia abyssalis TaxID=2792008 RepID=A0ABS6V0R2_9PSEU|nr:CHRD domain-containing protein [Pseudonocardia abyssalis]MBW0118941.1 CHRD domain-containing protein [Pseudonocardia abyssalis]MBW0137987.1 CHRD domain-containing protein [Pseudonocardia abyssalis]